MLEDGGQLPATPMLTHLVDKEYGIYEKDVNNYEGEVLGIRFMTYHVQHSSQIQYSTI